MAINVAEITSILKKEIAGFEQKVKLSEVGTVIEVGDRTAYLSALDRASIDMDILPFTKFIAIALTTSAKQIEK